MKYFNLQLFAASTSIKQEQSGGEEHSESHSTTRSHTEGGSHSESYGKTWLSGEVEDNTQQHRDKYNTDYQQGDKVTNAYDRLQQTLDKKPGFQSSYEDKLNSLYDSIMNREKFSYNFNADPMYQMYKDSYTQQGKRAMQDTMGQQAAMTGGYGSSYAQTVGQQTYQGYLQQLNDRLPEFRNMAYQQYQDEVNADLQKYNITSDAYNREYGQYRDSMSDWQSDRAFEQGNYQDERNFDYNQFANERNYWNDEYWKEKAAETSNFQVTDTSYWEDTTSQTDSYGSSMFNNWSNAMSMSLPAMSAGGGRGGNGGGNSGGSSAIPAVSGWYDSIEQRIKQSLAQTGAIPSNTTNNSNNNAYTSNYVSGSPANTPSSSANMGLEQSSYAINKFLTAETAVDRAIQRQSLKSQGYSDQDIDYFERLADERKRKR